MTDSSGDYNSALELISDAHADLKILSPTHELVTLIQGEGMGFTVLKKDEFYKKYPFKKDDKEGFSILLPFLGDLERAVKHELEEIQRKGMPFPKEMGPYGPNKYIDMHAKSPSSQEPPIRQDTITAPKLNLGKSVFSSVPKNLTDLLIPELLEEDLTQIHCNLEAVNLPSGKETVSRNVLYVWENRQLNIEGYLYPGETPQLVSLRSSSYKAFMEHYKELQDKGYSCFRNYGALFIHFRASLKHNWESILGASDQGAKINPSSPQNIEGTIKSFPFAEYLQGLEAKGLKITQP